MNQLLERAKKKARRLVTGSDGGATAPFDILNEAINFDLRSIFIAVPKTGTTSVRSQIKPQGKPMIPNPHLNIVQVRDLLYPFLLTSSLGRNRTFPSKNLPTDRAVRNEAEKIFDGCFKFSAVRNPWARAVSLFFRREGVQTRNKLTFEEFCEQHSYASDTCFHPTLHKNQFDWLCDENGEMIMDFVYKVEEFQDSIEEIADRTEGRVRLANQTSNKNPKSKSCVYREMYTNRTRDMISQAFEKDIDVFKYTF